MYPIRKLTEDLESALEAHADNIDAGQIAQDLIDRGWRSTGPDVSALVKLGQTARYAVTGAQTKVDVRYVDLEVGKTLTKKLADLGWTAPDDWYYNPKALNDLPDGSVIRSKDGRVGVLYSEETALFGAVRYVRWMRNKARPTTEAFVYVQFPVRLIDRGPQD